MSGADGWTWFLRVLAAINLANGLWMLADPAGWFVGIPAAVPDTGPLNEHFVRDVGAAYLTVAVALAFAAARPALRVPMVATVLVFHVLHAWGHVLDTAGGPLPPSHWLIDFPAIYLPTIALAFALWTFSRPPRGGPIAPP